jgi:hypothetical protein
MTERLATVHYLRPARRCVPMPDRFGDEPETEPEVHRCKNGWLDYYEADHPVPCLVCRPNLARAVRRADLERPVAVPGEPADQSGRRLRVARDGD